MASDCDLAAIIEVEFFVENLTCKYVSTILRFRWTLHIPSAVSIPSERWRMCFLRPRVGHFLGVDRSSIAGLPHEGVLAKILRPHHGPSISSGDTSIVFIKLCYVFFLGQNKIYPRHKVFVTNYRLQLGILANWMSAE